MKPEVIPNLLSVFRILLIVPAVLLILRQDYVLATAVTALAVFTDGLDGFLARRFGWHSRIGGFLDPVADKLLFVAVFLVLGFAGHIAWWLVALVIGRDIVIASGAFVYQRLIGKLDPEPTLLSKTNTVLLFLFVAAVMLQLTGLKWATAELVDVLRVLVVIMVVGSGLQYVWVWGNRAFEEARKHES